MAISLDDLVELDPIRGGRLSAREVIGMTRRAFIGTLAAASAAAIALMQRPALAHSTGSGGDYNITSTCHTTAYSNCGGCTATGRIIGGCCTTWTGGCSNGPGYHKHQHSTYDLRPDVCYGGYYDGWLWKWTACCYVGSGVYKVNRTWRCHDGRINGAASICRWVTSSGTTANWC